MSVLHLVLIKVRDLSHRCTSSLDAYQAYEKYVHVTRSVAALLSGADHRRRKLINTSGLVPISMCLWNMHDVPFVHLKQTFLSCVSSDIRH